MRYIIPDSLRIPNFKGTLAKNLSVDELNHEVLDLPVTYFHFSTSSAKGYHAKMQIDQPVLKIRDHDHPFVNSHLSQIV